MHRVRIAPGHRTGDVVTLPAAETHYVTRVLRLRSGQMLQAFDGAGQVYHLRLLAVSATTVQGELLAAVAAESRPEPSLILAQALPKGAKMETIIEKCSELGLTTLVPVYTARTVVRDIARDKFARWQRVAEAAARQCGRRVFLEILPPLVLTELYARYQTVATKLVCWEEEPRHGLHQALQAHVPWHPLMVLIGPEGGLTHEEIAMARHHGCVTVSLGTQVLRTETAAIAVVSILRYHLGALEPEGERA